MSTAPGTIGWIDLTVPNAEAVRDFYAAVVGWSIQSIPMGDYADYAMKPGEEAPPVAGICHARGVNTNVPACWLMYVTVADLDASIKAAVAKGGTLVRNPQPAGGHGTFAVIKDPSGAAVGLFQYAKA